eukprot:4920486-Prymnesium_polylepis.1
MYVGVRCSVRGSVFARVLSPLPSVGSSQVRVHDTWLSKFGHRLLLCYSVSSNTVEAWAVAEAGAVMWRGAQGVGHRASPSPLRGVCA